MKRMMTLCCALWITLAAPSSWAIDEHHPEQAKGAAATASKAPSTAAVDEQLRKMQAAREKAANAKTPEERQMAMMEQMQTMHDGMAMMKSMDGGMMGGGMMNCPGADKSKPGSNVMMDQHMKMMDMMMQMMGEQRGMMSMPMKQ